MDIYKFYQTYDAYLHKSTLTSDAVEPYLGFEELSPTFKLGGRD
jgi:hypothetical protein